MVVVVHLEADINWKRGTAVLSVGNFEGSTVRARIGHPWRVGSGRRGASLPKLLSILPLRVHTDKPIVARQQERVLEGLVAAVGSGRCERGAMQVPSKVSAARTLPRGLGND